MKRVLFAKRKYKYFIFILETTCNFIWCVNVPSALMLVMDPPSIWSRYSVLVVHHTASVLVVNRRRGDT